MNYKGVFFFFRFQPVPAHKDRLYLLARDVGNPSHKDPDFPVVRHQDYYNGFSWATGVVPGERQEESASEVLGTQTGSFWGRLLPGGKKLRGLGYAL